MNTLAGTAVLATLVLTAACAPGTANTPASGSVMPPSIVDPYLKISTALATDSIEGVRANAGDLATAATALGAPAMKIDTAAVQLAAATEVDAARDRFAALSDAIVAYMDGLHLTLPEEVRVAVCPMKQKPWLQQGTEIKNPYFGTAMPTCGDFR
jgi:Cu(I)/Ag(I) efflux system membrane fusion protein